MKILILLVFWALWFLVFSTRTLFSPLLPVIEDEFLISHALAGGIFAFFSLGYTVTLLLSGPLSFRIGYKRSIMLGFLILVLSSFLLNFAATYVALVVIVLFLGFGGGLYISNAVPLITETFGRRNWGKAIAFHETAAAVNILAVPLLVAVSLRFIEWRTLFIFLIGACLMAVIPFWVLASEPPVRKASKVRLSWILVRRDFWAMAAIWTFASMASNAIYNVTPLFLVKERGLDMDLANTVFGYTRAGILFALILIGFLSDRWGVRKSLFFIILTTGLSTVGMAFAHTTALLVTMLSIQATLSGAFFPVGVMAMSTLTSLEERATFMGTAFAIGTIVAMGITPVVLGAVADAWSFQAGILVVGILSTFSSACLKGLPEI